MIEVTLASFQANQARSRKRMVMAESVRYGIKLMLVSNGEVWPTLLNAIPIAG